MDKIQVFNYTDYRIFLKDALKERLLNSPQLSMRSIATKAGINSPNYLQRVIQGKPVGDKMAIKLSQLMKLRGPEEKYFRLMIDFSEADSSEHKKEVLLKLLQIRSKAQGKLATIFDNDIRKEWHLIVIWEMAAVRDITLTPETIVAALNKKINLSQAQKAIDFLIDKKYLRQVAPHQYEQTTMLLHSTDEIESVLLRNMHRKFIEMSLDRIDDKIEEKEFQGLTIAVNDETFKLIKKEIKKFIHDMAERFSSASDGNRVARLNLQLFSITSILRRKNEN